MAIVTAMHATGTVELAGIMNRARDLWPKVAEQIVIEVVEVMQAAAMAKVKEKPSTFRKTLLNSFVTQVITEGQGAQFRVLGHLTNETAYASVVDQGRTPGAKQPPVDALVPWVVQKIGIFTRFVRMSGAAKSSKSAARQSLNDSAAAAVRGYAFVIARSIGRKGIPGIHFMDAAIEAGVISIAKVSDRVLAEFIGNLKGAAV